MNEVRSKTKGVSNKWRIGIRQFCLIVSVATLGLVPVAMVVQATSSSAMTIGMVADNATGSVTVFNADTDTVLGAVSIGLALVGDCSITADQKLGFLTNFKGEVFVIDLTTSPPSLASGTNPISISNFGEDTSISPNQKFLVVCDGSNFQPVSVIDIASRTEVSTFDLGTDCNSVDVCSNGSVLVTSDDTGNVRRLTIDDNGNLTDTGEVLFSGGSGFSNGPNNVFCAPGGKSGIVITRDPHQLQSFTIPGLGAVGVRDLSGTFGISGQINPAGNRAFARSNGGAIDVFDYNSTIAALGASPLFVIPIADTETFYGIDQMALHPNGTKLYVSQPGALNVYNAGTGALLKSITGPNIIEPTGICFSSNRPPNCSKAAPSVSTLWPPNHKFISVNILGVTDPDGDPVNITINSIHQDEPTTGTGSGDTCPDANGVGTSTAQVLAERAGNGDGRAYHIGFTADDGKGGACTGEVTVCVPHDHGKGNTCVDEGPQFDSTVCK